MPGYISKTNNLKIIQFIVFGSVIMYFGSTLLIPLAYAAFITFILYPITEWLEKHKVPRGLAIGLSLAILIIIVCGIVFLLVEQAIGFAKQWPDLSQKLSIFMSDAGKWLLAHTSISSAQLDKWVERSIDNIGSNFVSRAGSTIYISTVSAIKLILIPVYVSLALYNREKILEMLHLMFPNKNELDIGAILHEVIYTFYRFIKGMITVYIVVGILNSIGLYILGIPDAIFFGFIVSILTFIPYVGIIIGSLLPVTVAWVMHDNIWYGVAVIAIFAFVQILEANIIFPLAVSHRLKVSTLFTIIAIFTGALLWGVSGMILFIPALGILKLVLSRIPGYEQVAKLL
jgi:predicted PurR-regulated permease PerM